MIVNGNLKLNECKNLTSLGNLKEVRGSFFYSNGNLKDLKELRYIEENIFISNINVFKISKKIKIGNNLILINIRNLEHLKGVEEVEIISIENCPNFNIKMLNQKIKIKELAWTIPIDFDLTFFSSKNQFVKLLLNTLSENIYDNLLINDVKKINVDVEEKKNIIYFSFIEKWFNETYHHQNNIVTINFEINLTTLSGYGKIDAKDLKGKRKQFNNYEDEDEFEDYEDEFEDLGHEYVVPNFKINNLTDIYKLTSADTLINIGIKLGIRYDY